LKLHACPFCGESDLLFGQRGTPEPGIVIHCRNCGATGPVGNDKEAACRLWNVRADIFS